MDTQGFMKTISFFGEPKIPDESDKATILASYARVLGRYDSDVLKLASEMMLDARGHRNFPLPEECGKWCQEAREELFSRRERESKSRRKPKASDNPWSASRIKAADSMMNSAIGRLAAQEDWIIALHDFCREEERLPSDHEASRVRLDALANKAIRDRLVEHPNYRQGMAMIAHAAKAMENKRERLSKIALRG